MKTAKYLWALLALLFAAPSFAQVPEDAMEAQRCIWRCLAEYGANDPAYGQCVAEQCDNEPAPSEPLQPATQQATLPPGPGVLTGTWAFGPHPVLGLSAYVQTGAGTIGIGCGTNQPLGLRFSNSFSTFGNPTLMIDPGQYAASYPRLQGDWSGRDGYACDIPVEGFAAGDAIYIVPAQIAAIHMVGEDAQITLTDGARQVVVITGPQAFAAFGGYAVPLTGANAAINSLLASCPVARQDVENGCGD